MNRSHRKLTVLLAAIVFFASASLNARDLSHEQVSLDCTPSVNNDWIFSSEKDVVLVLENCGNSGKRHLKSEVDVTITKDTGEKVRTISKKLRSCVHGAGSSLKLNLGRLEPGFYKVEISTEGGSQTKVFNIGVDPDKVVSAPDRQVDFTEFWDRARAELASVEPDYRMELIPERSNSNGDVYHVTMNSLLGHRLQCFLAVPKAEGKYPIVINYNGYGSTCWVPEPNSEYCVMTVSTRGQGEIEDNIYGYWIRWNIDNPEKYYYRAAFMDCVRAIDFAAQCDRVDPEFIFAQGGSQGGAFTLAAASLDHRLRAIAPDVPFLGDYPDYFRIVDWPAWEIREAQKEAGLQDEELFRNLSYFDIKNLTPWITCPVLMAFGLQDPVCPPHTNFSGFNNIPHSDKRWKVYPLSGHDVWTCEDWGPAREEFFRSFFNN